MDYFHFTKEAITCTTKLTASKDKWNAKEDTGKSMNNTYCGMPTGTSWVEAMSSSEKIQPVALAIIEIRLPQGIS